jgi:hypothetical protein
VLHGEADLASRLAHDFDDDAAGLRDALSGVAGIGKGTLDKGKAGTRGDQDWPRAVTVLD